jgi:hypothetical protein
MTTPTGTRSYLFVRPTPATMGLATTPSNWKSILDTLGQHGVQVMEECSGAPVGDEHSDLILSAIIKDYAQVPTIVNQVRKQFGLSVSVYPWESAEDFVSTLNKAFSKIEGAPAR